MARGIDHLVLAVRDLEAAAEHYKVLGFQVGGRNRHPWGTENRIIQLPGAFLELVTLGEGAEIPPTQPGKVSFAATVRDTLARDGDGFPMLVFESADAIADKAEIDAAGFGGFETFFFERTAGRPDGSRVRVAFTLAFAASSALPKAGFFVCQQHEPQNFWNPAFQQHSNGAVKLGGVVMLAPDARTTLPLLETLVGAPPACVGERNIAIVSPRGTVEAMTPAGFHDVLGLEPVLDLSEGPRLAAFKVTAPLAPMAERLTAAGIAFTRHRKHLALAARDNFGTALIFDEPKR
jgi:catechol 2,3-dioxygenase-like lactoylglutathione lyase family enzyme